MRSIKQITLKLIVLVNVFWLVSLLLSATFSNAAYSYNGKPYKDQIIFSINKPIFYLNGQASPFGKTSPLTFPVIKKSKTMIPIRGVMEAMNAYLYWDPDLLLSTIIWNGKKIELTVGSYSMLYEKTPIKMSVCPELIGGRLYVPISFITTTLKIPIKWVASTKTAMLYFDKPPHLTLYSDGDIKQLKDAIFHNQPDGTALIEGNTSSGLLSIDDFGVDINSQNEIAVTFLHNGAGNENSLLYAKVKPDNTVDTASTKLIFDNCKKVNPNTTVILRPLYMGDKIVFLISNTYYSLSTLNIESEKHTSVLKVKMYDGTYKYILGFEDLPIRDSDRDYNDVMFLITTNYDMIGDYRIIDIT